MMATWMGKPRVWDHILKATKRSRCGWPRLHKPMMGSRRKVYQSTGATWVGRVRCAFTKFGLSQREKLDLIERALP